MPIGSSGRIGGIGNAGKRSGGIGSPNTSYGCSVNVDNNKPKADYPTTTAAEETTTTAAEEETTTSASEAPMTTTAVEEATTTTAVEETTTTVPEEITTTVVG
jgi:hypothetical protein